MDISKILKPGQQINLDCETMNKIWNSNIFDIQNENILIVSPMEKMSYITVSIGTSITIIAALEAGMYKIPAKVIENRREPFVIVLKPSGEISPIQRRQFFRLKKPDVSVKYKLIRLPDDYHSKELKDAEVTDISGSGIAITTPLEKDMKPEMRIKLQINIPTTNTIINAIGKIIRCIEQKDRDLKVCLHFIAIEKRDRDRIIGYLFQEQAKRERRRR
ncbi:MAG TPA: PilZ domain-containing protein [Actinobacteria bacterium]|nr:PilZ domain-containing protein [Actinomycetota bacterium]